MPYLMIQSNRSLTETEKSQLLIRASATVAEALGKPEHYVMVAVEDGVAMSFGGRDAPCAYLELKSIGLPADRTTALSATLCQLIEEQLGIDKERVYIEFANAERHMWGYNGATFAR